MRIILLFTFLLLLINQKSWTQNQSGTLKTSKQSPCLFITSTKLSIVKQEIQTNIWKKNSWVELKNIADMFLKEKLEIPPRGGNWEEYYIDSFGNQLKRGKLIDNFKWEHINSKTGKIYLGDSSQITKDYDGVIISLIHDTWAIGAFQLGLVYQLCGDIKYANKAKEILLKYAEIYPNLKERNRLNKIGRTGEGGGTGKIHVQDLNESIWLIDIVESADLIWKIMTKEEKEKIVNNIFYPAVKVIKNSKPVIGNWQCYRNTAIGLVGFLTENNDLITTAMEDSLTGFTAQLKKGFSQEGIIIDLSPSYHFFSLNALCLLAQAAQNNGYKFDIKPLQRIFNAPIRLSNSRYLIPAFNDSKTINLINESYLYEWAYSQFKDSTFIQIIKMSNRGHINNLGPTFKGWSLFYGEPELSQIKKREIKNENFSEAGITKFTNGSGINDLSCYYKYTDQKVRPKGGHLHDAQLEFGIVKGLEIVSGFPGNINYASPLSRGYYKISLSHNSFTIDQKEQQPSTAKILSISKNKDLNYIMAETNNNDEDSTRFIRSMVLIDSNLILIVDQYFSKFTNSPLLDISYHQTGMWKERIVGEHWNVPEANGYKFLSDATINENITNFYLSTLLKSKREVMLSGVSSIPFDLITAKGKTIMNNDDATSLFRFNSPKLILAYCISLNGNKIKIQLNASKEIETQLELNLEDNLHKRYNIMINPDIKDENSKIRINKL